MHNVILSRLLLPLLATLSLSVTAAPASTPHQATIPSQSTQSHPTQINLNTADAPTLQKALTGIGQTKAEAIVTYRNTHGPFQSVDELLEVNGIGTSLVDRNRNLLTTE